MMNKIWSLAAMLLCVFAANSQTVTLKEVTGFDNPESVAASGKYLYVSNMGAKLEPNGKDGDGYISELSRTDGKVIEQKFYTGLNSPKGILIRCHTMYVADVDKVVAIDLKTKKKIWEADLSNLNVTYLNDMVRAGCGGLFVSSTDKNAIYKITKKGTKVQQLMVKGNIDGANGLYRSCCKLYISNYGRGGQTDGSFGYISLCNKRFKAFANRGVYDGMIRSCGRLIVSDWVSSNEDKGRIVVYKPCKKKAVELQLGRTLNGPSDIYKDCKTHLLWIPEMRGGKITSIPMKQVKMLACEKKKK